MINQEQSREFTRFTKLSRFLSEHQTVFSGFEPFAEEYAVFNTNMANFENLIPEKNKATTGITAGKNALKQKLSESLGLICRKTYAYALKYNNPQLAAQVNTRADKIFKIKDSGLQGYVTAITEAITPLLANADFMKYNISATQLGALTADAAAFNDMIGQAGVADSGNTVANAAIDKVIAALRQNMKHFELLLNEFDASAPAFVQGYHINGAIDNTGIRHSGIEGHVRSSRGEAISGAAIRLLNTTKSVLTDLQGFYHLDRVHPGDYIVEGAAAGYMPQSQPHHINRGRIEELNFVLQVL